MLVCRKKIGDVPAMNASEIPFSRVGIGFEKLDRAVFDPEKAYDKVAALGVKWVRIQSGWQRTEKSPGVYSFEWLDSIVDNLRKRSLLPWICLCYGNGLYDSLAAERFGAVGCAPTETSVQIRAWHDYVAAIVRHFEGRVDWWEIWNEPDGGTWRTAPSAAEYTAFARATACAIREGSSRAKVIGGAFANSDIRYIASAFEEGLGSFCDALSFHIYSPDEATDVERISNLKCLARAYNPELELIQGEGGCQSRPDGRGALAGQAWSPEKQAKSMARHLVSQLGDGMKFVSYFSCMDMIEALNGKNGEPSTYRDFGYFGVLGADFDENGFSSGEYTPKPSYRTLQTIATVFRGDFVPEVFPVQSEPESDPRFGYLYRATELGDCIYRGFRRPSGAAAFAYWKKSDLLRETSEGSITLYFFMVPDGPLRLVDLVDGSVYALNESDIERIPAGNGKFVLRCAHLPLFDRPMLLTFGDFF